MGESSSIISGCKKVALSVLAICISATATACSSKQDDPAATTEPLASSSMPMITAAPPADTPAPKTQPASDADNTIIATATGEYYIAPDVAYISVGMRSTGSSAEQVQKTNDEAMTKVLSEIKKAGIAEEDIKTNQYSVYPEYNYSSSTRIIKGYVAVNTASVTINDISRVGAVLEAANKSGANEIGDISFSVKDRDSAYDRALEAAIRTARQRAEVMAGAAGVEIGGLVQVSEKGYSSPYVYRAYESAASSEAEMDNAAYDAGISVGEMKITATAQVVFEIK